MTTGFYIDMINVGQGDAFLLTLGGPEGDATVLIDAGPPLKGETVGEFLVSHAAGHLDLVIGTHLDIDHIGGIRDVASSCTIGALFLNVPVQSTAGLRKALRQRFLQHSSPGSNYEALNKSVAAANELVDALEHEGVVPQSCWKGAAPRELRVARSQPDA